MTDMNGLEYRSATQVAVSWPERTIEIIVMPYDDPTPVLHHGRVITEVCERGAYDGIERRANRVRVNRDHDITRTIGRAFAMHPSRDEGLVAELRISPTPLGDETLALAADDVLDASAGFTIMAGGESWNADRSERRLRKVWLAHIAMTPDPAYEGARTLAVRSTADVTVSPLPVVRNSDTPNLDQIRLWRLEEMWRAKGWDT